MLRGLWILGIGFQSLTLLGGKLVPQSIQREGSVAMRLGATVLVFFVPSIVVYVTQWMPLLGYVLRVSRREGRMESHRVSDHRAAGGRGGR